MASTLQTVASAYSGTFGPRAIVEFNGELYAGTGDGTLVKWDGAGAWVLVAPQLSTYINFQWIIVYNGELYGILQFGRLVKFDGVSSLVEVAPPSGSLNILCLEVHNGKLYGGGTGVIGQGVLWEWNDVNAWIAKSTALATEGGIHALLSYGGSLYGFTSPTYGYLVQWDGVNTMNIISSAWGEPSQVFPKTLIQVNGTIYAGESNSGKLKSYDGVSAWVDEASQILSWRVGFLSVVANEIYMTPTGGSNTPLYVWDKISAWVEEAPSVFGISFAGAQQTAVFNNQLFFTVTNKELVRAQVPVPSGPAGKFPISLWGYEAPTELLSISTWGYIEGSALPEILNFCQEAKDLLVEQFKNSPLLQGLICALISEYQELYDVYQDLKVNRALATASGEQLDELGEIIGLPRSGLTDTNYRTALTAAIFFNVSNGEPETIIAYIKAVTQASSVIYSEIYPASVYIATDGAVIPSTLLEDAKKIVPAGVGLEVVTTGGSLEQFAFDPEGIPDPFGQGFGENSFPSEGGTIAEKLV